MSPMESKDSAKERNIIYYIKDKNVQPRNTINTIEHKIKYKIGKAKFGKNNSTNVDNNNNAKNGQLSLIWTTKLKKNTKNFININMKTTY